MDTQTIRERLESLVTGIDHFTIAVRDLDTSIQWYEKALGFFLSSRKTTSGEHTSMHSAVLRCGEAVVVLVQGEEPESQVNRFIAERGEGVTHIAFVVRDLDQAIHQVEQAGGAASLPAVEGEGIRQAFLERDEATGVRIELIERQGGDFNERSIETLYRRLEERQLY